MHGLTGYIYRYNVIIFHLIWVPYVGVMVQFYNSMTQALHDNAKYVLTLLSKSVPSKVSSYNRHESL